MVYRHQHAVGVFHITQTRAGRWDLSFMDEWLGNYKTAEMALDDLLGGHTFTASCGDTSRLELPDDLAEWRPSAS